VAVLRVAKADDDPGAGRAELRDLVRREGEMDELHGGCLALRRGSVDVGFGHAHDRFPAELDEHRLLDPATTRQEGIAPARVVSIAPHRSAPFTPPRDRI